MGDFRIVIEASGGHGCQREVKDGGKVYGCGRMGCPDCETRRFVDGLQRSGAQVNKADLVHWPADMEGRGYTVERQVKDNLLTRIRSGSFAIAALVLGLALLPSTAQAAQVGAGAVLGIGAIVLHLVLPLLAAASGTAITWIIAKEAIGFGLLKAKTKSAAQLAAVDMLQHLAATATQAVLGKLASDVAASKSAAEIASDALAALQQAVPTNQLLQLAGQVAGIGADELTWYLTHLLTAHAAVATGKVLAVQAGVTAGMNLAQKRELVANQGKPIS